MSAEEETRLQAWVTLGIASWTSTRPWVELLAQFDGDPVAVARAESDRLAGAGAGPRAIEALEKARREGAAIVADARRRGLSIAPIDAAEYPPLLREIPDPPLVLYWRGVAPSQCDPAVAIVGSRRCSDYGLRTAASLAKDVAAAGILVVSGLARGIDAAAHRGALAAGRTAAVLAGGLDRIYPTEHTSLAHRIVETGGCILSEQPPGRGPLARMFPYRNRIITGLARATVVVEAGARSGSLASARHALAQGRDVYAVPGPVDSPYSQGTNALVRDGCYLLSEGHDLAATAGLAVPARRSPAKPRQKCSDFNSLSTDGGRAVLAALRHRPTDLDGLVEATSLDGGRVLAFLTALEMDGLVVRGWGGSYSCTGLGANLSLPGAAPRSPQHP